MHGEDSGREREERAYRTVQRKRLRQMRGHMRHMQDHLREMDDHLRELDEHLRHEEEESERWHRKWDDPSEGA